MRRYAFAKGQPRRLWIVRRGPLPEEAEKWHASVVWHPVVVCSRAHTMKWEAGWSGDSSWVWERLDAKNDGGGFLLTRWNGLDIDYGHIVRSFTLPDGTDGAFSHPHTEKEPWSLLPGAVWWSDHLLPQWLADRGVVLAEDEWTLRNIEEDSGLCLLGVEAGEKIEDRRFQERGPKLCRKHLWKAVD